MAEFTGQIPQKSDNQIAKTLSRRDFLKLSALGGTALELLLSACGRPLINLTPTPTPTPEKPGQSIPLLTDVPIKILDSYNLTPGSQEYQRLAAQSADLLKADEQKNIVYSNRQGQVVTGSLKDIVGTVSLANSDLVPNPESAAATTLPYEIKVGDQSIIINPVFFEVNNKIDPQQRGTMFFLLANVDGQWREIYLINTQGSSLSTLSVPNHGVFINGLIEGSTNFAFPLTEGAVSFDLMAIEGKPGGGAFNTIIFASISGGQKQLVVQNERGVRVGLMPDSLSLQIGESPSPSEPTLPTPLPQPTNIPLFFDVSYNGVPTESPTPTATAKPTEVPLPSEFLSQFPDGGYEIRNDGVYAPDATGNMRLWYEKQPDETLKEVYFRSGKPLTEEKKAELAQMAECGNNSCVWKTNRSPIFELDCISTGIIERQSFIDLRTNLAIGTQFNLVVVARNSQNQSFDTKIVIQLELNSQPGINQFYEMAGFLQGYGLKEWPKGSLGMEDLGGIFREGILLHPQIAYNRNYPSLSTSKFIDILNPYYDEINYVNIIQSFLTKGGVNTPPAFFMFYYGFWLH